MNLLNFGWLTGKDKAGEEAADPTRRAFLTGAAAFTAAGAAIVVSATKAQAWHRGYDHHNKWESRDAYDDDYHSRRRSSYRRRKYYHRKYGSWHDHPQCLHLGPFGVCEY